MRDIFQKIHVIFPILGFVSIFGVIFYLMESENSDLRDEINTLNSKIEIRDSTIISVKKSLIKYEKLVEKIKNEKLDCPPTYGYKLNGEFLSTEQLLDELIDNWNLVDSLKYELGLRNKFLEYIQLTWGVKVVKENDSYTIQVPKESRIAKTERKLEEVQFILDELKNRYELKYELRTDKSNTSLVFNFNKLDSALLLYPFFKSHLRKEKGNFIITH
ncbi:MAG: hypothetical protein RLY43_2372 [Bacteroidota bacterium]|jgi:hypothetical protein